MQERQEKQVQSLAWEDALEENRYLKCEGKNKNSVSIATFELMNMASLLIISGSVETHMP